MTAEKFKKGTFKIAVNTKAHGASSDDGTRTGLINGVFGITGSTGYYRVTHLASGLLCGETRTQSGAKSLCERLTALSGIDWSTIHPLHTVDKALRARVLQLVRESLSE